MATKANVPAITKAASLAAKQFARLEAEAQSVQNSEIERRERSLRLISSGSGGFSALIKHGKMAIQIEGNDFAITTQD